MKKNDALMKNFEYGILNLLFLGVAFSFFFFVNPQFISSSSNRKQLTEKVYAKVHSIRGKAYALGKDSDIWVPITRGDYVLLGDFVVSTKASELSLEIHRSRKKKTLNPGQMFYISSVTGIDNVGPNLSMFSVKPKPIDSLRSEEGFQLGSKLPEDHRDFRLKAEDVRFSTRGITSMSESKNGDDVLKIRSYYNRQEEIRYWAVTDFELAENVDFVETKLYFAWDQWKHEKQDILWRVEVSEKPDFSEIVFQESLGNASEVLLSFNPGEWFVRASARRRYSNNEYVGGAVLFKVRSPKQKASIPEIRIAKKEKRKKIKQPERRMASLNSLIPYDLSVSEYSEELFYLDWKVDSFNVSSFHYQLYCEETIGLDSEQAYLGQAYHYVWKELAEECSFRVRTRLPNWSPWSESKKISL